MARDIPHRWYRFCVADGRNPAIKDMIENKDEVESMRFDDDGTLEFTVERKNVKLLRDELIALGVTRGFVVCEMIERVLENDEIEAMT